MRRTLLCCAAAFAATTALTPALASATPGVASADVVIAAAYGGGGNSGPTASFQRDFVELFNRGSAPVTLTSYSLQYIAPTSGTANWIEPIPTVTIPAGGHYLFEGYNSGGATATQTLPAADLSVSGSTWDIKRDSWTLVLASQQTAISGDTDAAIKDELGVGPTLGSTPRYAATAPAPAVSNTTVAVRNSAGCANTNNNSADFTITAGASVVLYNAASAATPCANQPALPESRNVALLAMVGLAVAGGAVVVARRRRSA